jgi:hypothetical protein
MSVFVLNKMQMLDQKIALARAIGQQSPDFIQGDRVDLPALRGSAWTPTSLRGFAASPNSRSCCAANGTHEPQDRATAPSEQWPITYSLIGHLYQKG